MKRERESNRHFSLPLTQTLCCVCVFCAKTNALNAHALVNKHSNAKVIAYRADILTPSLNSRETLLIPSSSFSLTHIIFGRQWWTVSACFSTSKTGENIEHVTMLVRLDRCLTLRMLSEQLYLNRFILPEHVEDLCQNSALPIRSLVTFPFSYTEKCPHKVVISGFYKTFKRVQRTAFTNSENNVPIGM